MRVVFRRHMDVPSKNARRGCEPGARSAEGALRGVLSFGYFSLHKQRKVTRRQAKALLLHLLICWQPLARRSGFSRGRHCGSCGSRLKPLLKFTSSDMSFNSKGFRPDGRVTFLCSRKEKVTKRKRALPRALRAARSGSASITGIRGRGLAASQPSPGQSPHGASPPAGAKQCFAFFRRALPCRGRRTSMYAALRVFPRDGRRVGREPGKSKARATAKAKQEQEQRQRQRQRQRFRCCTPCVGAVQPQQATPDNKDIDHLPGSFTNYLDAATHLQLVQAQPDGAAHRYASAASIAARRRGSSAVTSGAKRARTWPSRPTRNFSKFHSTPGAGFGSMP